MTRSQLSSGVFVCRDSRALHDTSVVVGAIQPTVGFDSLVDHSLNLGRGRHIGSDEDRFAASGLDEVYSFLTALNVHISDDDLGSFSGEGYRGSLPDAGAATSHQRDSSLKRCCHV